MVITAILAVLAVTRARRRREVLVYAWLMPASTVLQAVIGGITVRTGLLWWTVAVHLLVSMVMVWLATLLFIKVGEPDDGVVTEVVPNPLRWLTFTSGLALAATLFTGSLVTGAGPHAGDKSPQRVVPRLEIEVVTLVHAHVTVLVCFLSLLVGLGADQAVAAPPPVIKRLAVLVGLVIVQGLIGEIQYHRRAAGPGGDACGGRNGLHRGHRGTVGVDAARRAPSNGRGSTGRAAEAPALQR